MSDQTPPKTALVTGGNRGIGLAICRQLADAGIRTLLGARSAEKGQAAVDELKNAGYEVHLLVIDVSNESDVQRAAKVVEEEYGGLDILINNAGIGVMSNGVINAATDEIKTIMETNFYGPMYTARAFYPQLKKSSNGRIINMSSGMGALDDLVGGYAGYRLSKAGLNAQTILLANEAQADGIAVNAMCPGWVRTDMGGNNAPRDVDQGADTAVWLATVEPSPTGQFFRDRKQISW